MKSLQDMGNQQGMGMYPEISNKGNAIIILGSFPLGQVKKAVAKPPEIYRCMIRQPSLVEGMTLEEEPLSTKP